MAAIPVLVMAAAVAINRDFYELQKGKLTPKRLKLLYAAKARLVAGNNARQCHGLLHRNTSDTL